MLKVVEILLDCDGRVIYRAKCKTKHPRILLLHMELNGG